MVVSAPIALLLGLLGLVVAILAVVFVLVPFMKGLGWLIGNGFRGVGWLFAHIFEFIFGVIGDAIRFIGSIPVFLIFGVFSVLNVVIGRWSAAGHFCDAAMRECSIAGGCLYRMAIRRPLKLVLMHGLLEGMEERVPQAMGGAPGKDKPGRRTGQFDGYVIVGSLRGGGSGGKLYIAEPTPEKRAAIPSIPDRVVIKSFALADGSSLPQIVRESRALECAKQLGHVIEHGMTPSRFHYVMPYIPGDHLGLIARDQHAKSDGHGLSPNQLSEVTDYVVDLVATLSAYHKGGFWHKDVKPENVIVHEGRAHLVDLGLVTPLTSAMTLTTHGTEYFRDPEMVRQALRGVKVHQVDGARFDVYAAGAVLYYLLENTFPAHGGLSAFQKKSPEAMRWIVRRSMAEYNQRYRSADVMLADLHFVATAKDPFAVKPVDLPSMKGAEIPEVPVEAPHVSRVVSAGTPLPHENEADDRPASVGYGIAAGVGAAGAFAQAGRFAIDDEGRPASPSGSPKGRRPRLRVTNWWTGQYVVDDPGTGRAPAEGRPEVDPVAAAAASAGRAREAWNAARVNARKSGRTAKEQLAAARGRAKEARARARSRHASPLRAPSERHPSAALGTLAVLFVALVLGGVFIGRGSIKRFISGENVTVAVTELSDSHSSVLDLGHTQSVFVINDYPKRDTRSLSDGVKKKIRDFYVNSASYVQSSNLAEEIRGQIPGALSGDSAAEGKIQSLLTDQNCAAVIWFQPDPDSRGKGFVTHNYVVTKQPVALRTAQVNLPTPKGKPGRLVLINDHPAMAQSVIIQQVNSVRGFYTDLGYDSVEDMDAEAEIRQAVQMISVGEEFQQSPALLELMEKFDLAAVVVITGGTQDEGPRDRFDVELVERDLFNR